MKLCFMNRNTEAYLQFYSMTAIISLFSLDKLAYSTTYILQVHTAYDSLAAAPMLHNRQHLVIFYTWVQDLI